MKIHFHIPYSTKWGQRLLVTGNIPELGNNIVENALALQFQHPGYWTGEIETKNTDFNYRYILYTEQNNHFLEEWGKGRDLSSVVPKTEHLFCYDFWNSPAAVENTFLTAPFAKVLLKHNDTQKTENSQKKPTAYSHVFRVKAPLLTRNQVVCIIGDCSALGNWNTKKPKLLNYKGDSIWQTELNFSNQPTDVHYKYGLYDLEDNRFISFELGNDRTAAVVKAKNTLIKIDDGFYRSSSNEWRGAGVGLPVFSLRSKKSFGVGDFEDLKLFVDWAQKTGLKLIQVLPLNDTIGTHTEADVLPYAAISAFALNPLFLHLPAIGKLPSAHPMQKSYNTVQKELNSRDLVPFLEVINFKLEYARELYLLQKKSFLKNGSFIHFFNENAYWLTPYAVYCVLRNRLGTSDYRQWNDFAIYDKSKIEEFIQLSDENFDDVAVNYFIQYHLHLQLSSAAGYAHQQGVVLKGDIPIGVNRNSVDTWVSPELFNMNMQAGAPPDMFSVKGQNWALPTYNWEKIKETGFDWWKKRFTQMSNYFDTFRVDHILGFFRIWQIPLNQQEGIMGHLHPSKPVHINEFSEKGLWFDYNRYCKPYITDSILWELFGEEMHWVKTNCLQIEDGWNLRLKSPYDSQTAVANLYNEGKISEKIKWGLFDLISNVLFFEVEGSNRTLFYPRFGMDSLAAFRDIDDYSKNKLKEIYVDYFYRRQDEHWYHSGMEKLPALKRASNMLICGEDLGMMTKCVTDVMNELGILSLEVQRAPKTDKLEFFHPANAPYLSVVTPSTHDMSTVRGWWEEDRGVTQRFYNTQLGHWGEAPYFCEWWICRDILLQHLYSPAMWAIFQLQDLLAISEEVRRKDPNEERINVPSNSMSSWRYRMHITMEELLEKDSFNEELRNFIIESGR